MVARVARDTPAWTGGLSPGDEILGIDAYRVGPEQWEKRMGQYRPGEEITLLVSRNERITSVRVRLEPDPAGRWRIVVDPARTEQQQIQFEQWLGTNQHPKNF
jgi:predicted metalloprotease with PDZ domain